MASDAQVSANQANALLSTGPATAHGKRFARLNALKHGLAARGAVAPGEVEEAFDRFRDGVRRRLRPRGEAESGVVDRLVVVAWKLRRVAVLEQSLLHEQLDDGVDADAADPAALILDEIETEGSTLLRLQVYEYRLEKMHASLLRQLERLREMRAASDEDVEAGAEANAV